MNSLKAIAPTVWSHGTAEIEFVEVAGGGGETGSDFPIAPMGWDNVQGKKW